MNPYYIANPEKTHALVPKLRFCRPAYVKVFRQAMNEFFFESQLETSVRQLVSLGFGP